MALMPGLQLNVSQQLKLTPQLQQSIKILQYSALEVQQTISTMMETNYMLEVEDLSDTDDLNQDEDSLQDSQTSETSKDDSSDDAVDASEREVNLAESDRIVETLEIDCDWDEVYSDYQVSQSSNLQSIEDYKSPETFTASEVTLKDKLYWQSDIHPWEEHEELIASYLIDDIDDEGYLKVPLEEILEDIQARESDIIVNLHDLEQVLSVIQDFEPNGVGARNLSECLIIQLNLLKQTPFVVTARKMIEENFELLTLRDYKRLKKIYMLDDEELHEVIQIIQSLNPRPGREYSPSSREFVIPDLMLSRTNQGFMLELNQDAFPRLRVNSTYINMAKDVPNSTDDGKRLREQLAEAKGLIKSIQSRGETLLRVGRYIIEKQARFFDEGEQAMQPMVLRDVAESLELHESTISRATNQKFMQTPRGTFELKYFFSTGVSQYGSEDQSAIAIKSHIKQLIDEENSAKPLSDNKLMGLLEDKGINVARRTIAKYREAMGIPSSSERKKLNKFK